LPSAVQFLSGCAGQIHYPAIAETGMEWLIVNGLQLGFAATSVSMYDLAKAQ